MAARNGPGGLIKLALVIGVAAPVVMLAGAGATKFGITDWQTGFGLISMKMGFWTAVVGVVAGLAAVLLSLKDFRRWGLMALVALAIPAAVLGGILKLRADARALPPIHDVATDWSQPLGFSDRIMDERAGSPNAVEADPRVPDRVGPPWGGRRIAEINAETCPGARPVMRSLDPDQVAEAMEAAGVQVIGRAPWRVEGTHESFWFGFKDDVVARIQPHRTDFRSISRVGMSDIGANCARVTKIVKALGG